MNDEQKYNEALEKAREYYNSPRTCFDISALAEIFPELKKSDTERIIDMMLDQMVRWNQMAKENGVEQDIKDSEKAIDLLEKWKEAKNTPLEQMMHRFGKDYHIAWIDGDPKEVVKKYLPMMQGQPSTWGEAEEELIEDVSEYLKEYAQFISGEYTREEILEAAERIKLLRPIGKQMWTDKDQAMLIKICKIIYSARVTDKTITLAEESEMANWMDKWLNHEPRTL